MSDAPSSNSDVIRRLFTAVDGSDYDTIASLAASDVHFRFGNSDPTDTRSDLVAAARSFRAAIAEIRHTVVDLWEVDDTVIAVMDVFYRRLDGTELTLPCCNIFRVRDGLVHSYLIYMDVNPVLAP